MLQHEFFESLDLARYVFFAHLLHFRALHCVALKSVRFPAGLFAVNAVNQIPDLFDDGTRGDAVRQVMSHLFDASAFGFTDGALHRVRHLVGVQNGPPLQIARGAADGLNQGALGAQKALLIGIQNRDQRDLGNIEPFTQQVDANQYVKNAEPQVAQNLDTLHSTVSTSLCR